MTGPAYRHNGKAGTEGTRRAFPGGGEGARADDSGGSKKAGRVAPRHGA